MEILRANQLSDKIRYEMSQIFVDGFYQWLQFFSKNKNNLTHAFMHMFNLDYFYVAIIDNNVVGMVACNDGKDLSVHLQRKEFTKHLGFFKGFLCYLFLRQQFERKGYPFPIEDEMGMIEFVATSINYRHQGVASSIIREIIKSTPFKSYVLEVADTNISACNLYEKLGFKEFMRVKEKHKSSGINYFLYMKLIKE